MHMTQTAKDADAGGKETDEERQTGWEESKKRERGRAA